VHIQLDVLMHHGVAWRYPYHGRLSKKLPMSDVTDVRSGEITVLLAYVDRLISEVPP
jgi:hypothetical protein